jgi:hypothetical protein
MSWTARGCIVLDRLLHVKRCPEIEVYYDYDLPSKEVVRKVVDSDAPIQYFSGLRSSVFCFDRIGLKPDNTLSFVDSDMPIMESVGEWLTKPQSVDIGIEDALRLKSIVSRYPELVVSPRLVDLANAAHSFVLEMSGSDPNATLLLTKYGI